MNMEENKKIIEILESKIKELEEEKKKLEPIIHEYKVLNKQIEILIDVRDAFEGRG